MPAPSASSRVYRSRRGEGVALDSPALTPSLPAVARQAANLPFAGEIATA